MVTTRPDFLDSEFFYIDENGWQMKKEAPEALKKEFDEYMGELKQQKY